ncbi:MAG: type IV toxin-antitoxin system AbiEi family antitoxin [Elusimicrobia bacterium]|nr:type IV toxin-antitoxin system AbiEi family antitoxin [Elusimicrobiota bacterium]
MAKFQKTKLNTLVNGWPKGVVIVAGYFRKLGISRQLSGVYKRSNWIAAIGRGAYIRPGEKLHWTGGVYALQAQLGLPVHAGGKTALQMQGYRHFLPFRGGVVCLFGEPKTRLPGWFLRYKWGDSIRYAATGLFTGKPERGLVDRPVGEYILKISSPEKAMLELLYQVPGDESFEEAMLLMQGLATLRPVLTQELLQDCASVKAKRLFLYMAETCAHPWFKKLDLSKIGLGSGKRVIVPAGRLASGYNITVPFPEGEKR